MIDERAYAATLRGLRLDGGSTLVDLGAGTGVLAAAAARLARRVVAVDPSPAMQRVSRVVEAARIAVVLVREEPALDHLEAAARTLPDYWKAIALARVHDLLAAGSPLVLRDIAYAFEPAEADDVVAEWVGAPPDDPAAGWTADELARHVRTEHSTFSWLLEPMPEHAGLEIRDVRYSDSRTYALYVCARR